MLILGVDTSTAQVGVAVGSGDELRAEVRLAGARRHTEQLVPAIAYLLSESGLSLGDLDALAVGVGPGLFTGLRVGVTTVKVMAQALGLPVATVPSLDLVAWPLRHVAGPIVVAIDARRGEVYTAAYRSDGDRLVRESGERVIPPADLAAELEASGTGALLAGNGILAHPDVFRAVPGLRLAGPSFAAPSPAALVEVAARAVARGECLSAQDVQPLYLRKSDAEIVGTPG